MAEGPAKSTGWQLLGRIQSSLSLTELSNITAQQLIDALKVQSHDDIAIEVPSRQSTTEGSWSSTRHQQLHLLLGAVTNVLQLYGGTDTVSNSLSCAPMIELLLLEASALLAKAVECTFSVEPHQHMPIYQQRGQLPEHVMFVLQLLDVVEDCCLIDALEAACLQAVTDLPTACQAPSQHAHVPYLYAQILTMQVQVMQISAAVKPQHRCFRSKGVLESFAGCALALLRLSDADFQPDNTPAAAVSTAAATAESAPADASHWPEGYWQRQQRSLSAEVQPAVLSCASLLFTSFSEACSSVEHNPAGGNLRGLDAGKVPCFIDLALLLMAMYVALVHRQHAERVRTATDSVASSSSSSSSGGGGRPSSRSSNSHCSSSGSRDSGASLPQQQQQWEPWPAQQAPDYHSALLQQVPNHEQLLRGSWWCLSRGCLNASDWLLLDLHVSALENVVKHVGPLSGDAFVRWGQLLVEHTLLLQIKDSTQLWRLDSALGALQSACMPGGERQQGLTAQGAGYSQQQQQGWRCSDFEYMGLLPEEAQQLLVPVLQQLAPFVLHTLQQAPAAVRAWDEKGRAKLQDWPQEYAQRVEQLQHMRCQLQNPQERLQRGVITEEQHAWYEGMFQEMENSLEQLRLRHLTGQELAKHVQEVQKQRNSMLQAVGSFTEVVLWVCTAVTPQQLSAAFSQPLTTCAALEAAVRVFAQRAQSEQAAAAADTKQPFPAALLQLVQNVAAACQIAAQSGMLAAAAGAAAAAAPPSPLLLAAGQGMAPGAAAVAALHNHLYTLLVSCLKPAALAAKTGDVDGYHTAASVAKAAAAVLQALRLQASSSGNDGGSSSSGSGGGCSSGGGSSGSSSSSGTVADALCVSTPSRCGADSWLVLFARCLTVVSQPAVLDAVAPKGQHLFNPQLQWLVEHAAGWVKQVESTSTSLGQLDAVQATLGIKTTSSGLLRMLGVCADVSMGPVYSSADVVQGVAGFINGVFVTLREQASSLLAQLQQIEQRSEGLSSWCKAMHRIKEGAGIEADIRQSPELVSQLRLLLLETPPFEASVALLVATRRFVLDVQHVSHEVLKFVPLSQLCCSNPACVNVAGLGECTLVRSSGLCGGCKAARYCSKACQEQDWQVHKVVCREFR